MKVLIALITIISWLLVHQAQVQASSVFNYAAAAASVASHSKLLLHWLENHDPDELRNTSELIRSKGYVAEEHDVQTDDGYILSIQRIPHGINGSQSSGPRPVVLLQHGLFDCSATWVMNFPSQSLGFILADAGYDVWLGNMRGNTYGMRHVKYNPKTDDAFWNFSFDEMAKHDLPSMINYVLKQTNQSSLYYVGHSQGTLIGFIQFGQDPALAAKVKAFAALGPVATVGHIVSPLKYIADVGRNSTQLIWYQFLGRKQMMTSSALERWLADFMCNVEEFDKVFCENILFIFCGPSKHMNMTRIPVYTTHDPAGTSVKNLIHFSQGVISDKFQKFDYGSAKANMAAYNQPTPPEYSLKPVTLPVGLFWAKDDWLADPVDVKYLKQNLPNVVYEQYIDDWNHLDFIWAIDAAARMYPNIINLFRKFP